MSPTNAFTVAAARHSAAVFPYVSHERFPKGRHAPLPPPVLPWLALCFILLHSSFCLRALGQSYSIDWFKVSGGGGASTGGVYSVSGTIGQHDAGGPMTGSGFSLTGGFWSLYAVQTPGAPLLSIQLTTTNTVMVSWPSPSTGWNLQQNNDLTTANWVAAPAPTDNGTIKYVIVNPPAGKQFYRLKQ